MVDLTNAHILLVEQDKTSIEVLAEILSQANVSYTLLTDPSDVMSLREDLPNFSAIFLDLDMTGLTGYEVLTVLKSLPELEFVPIVAYTAHLNEMATARSSGFDGFLGKPLRSMDFPNQLARILNHEQVWAVR